MNKINLILVFSAFYATAAVNAQTKFEVPKNVELKAKEDYAKYEALIIDAAKWLEETDLDKEIKKRQEVNAFVLQWISGSPDVSIELNEKLSKIYDKNSQLLGVYLSGYTRYCLENKGSVTRIAATKAGIVSMMKVYRKGIDIRKGKEMEKLIKLSDDKLDEYVQDNFK